MKKRLSKGKAKKIVPRFTRVNGVRFWRASWTAEEVEKKVQIGSLQLLQESLRLGKLMDAWERMKPGQHLHRETLEISTEIQWEKSEQKKETARQRLAVWKRIKRRSERAIKNAEKKIAEIEKKIAKEAPATTKKKAQGPGVKARKTATPRQLESLAKASEQAGHTGTAAILRKRAAKARTKAR